MIGTFCHERVNSINVNVSTDFNVFQYSAGNATCYRKALKEMGTLEQKGLKETVHSITTVSLFSVSFIWHRISNVFHFF